MLKSVTLVIPSDHPLRRLFRDLITRGFRQSLRMHDPQTCDYVAGVLTDFADVRNLYRIRDARGKRLEEVGEMLIESNPLLEGRSFDREREVRKHIGDFTLFFTGVFPEHLNWLARRRRVRLDAFIDYMKAGKESYAIVSEFNLFEYREEAPLFRRLADNFESCVFGLNLVKRELERLQQGDYRRLKAGLNQGLIT